MSNDDKTKLDDGATGVWRPILVVLLAVAGAFTAIVSCEDTGPSPVGVHPDDAEPEDTGPAKTDAGGGDGAGGDGGDGGEEEDAEPQKDASDSSTEDVKPIQDAKTDG